MKAFWILAALAGVAAASPPPPEPDIEQYCRGPLPWDKMATCIERYEQGTTIKKLATEVKVAVTRTGRLYLFAQVGESWRIASQLGDENYELVQRSTLMLGKVPAVRIDLSHHVPLGNDGVFLERVTHICTDTYGCRAMVTACTVIQHGRAVETFRGELMIDEGTANVIGDRTHSARYCLGR